MADALISPAVGGTMWAVSGGLIACCARKVRQSARDNLVPLMGVMGAFIFAAQMVNFAIPGTGSSGHLGGGLILAVALGPWAAFLVIASVLTVQAFFFADGGLLALGCNIFNLGFFPAFVAYPLIYRALSDGRPGSPRAWTAALAAAVAGLQLGALGVVLETAASGVSELPLRTFLLVMLPIHLAIGLAEGAATAVVIAFIARARPEALQTERDAAARGRLRPVVLGLAAAAALVGGAASRFASARPDGLEWSIAKVAGREEVGGAKTGAHAGAAKVQQATALMPDYGFKSGGGDAPASPAAARCGTSVAGLAGGAMTLALAGLAGLALRAGARRSAR